MAFEPSNVEKLILWMLADIGEKVDPKNKDYDLIREALNTGNFWAIEWDLPGVFADARPDAVVKETTDILDMWSFIEEACEAKFPGFDGNREAEHVSVARMLTDKMERFESFKGRVGDGVLGLDGYRRMYAVFEPIRNDLGHRNPPRLSPNEAEEILAERVHPENR